jgi:hypothetical protein
MFLGKSLQQLKENILQGHVNFQESKFEVI